MTPFLNPNLLGMSQTLAGQGNFQPAPLPMQRPPMQQPPMQGPPPTVAEQPGSGFLQGLFGSPGQMNPALMGLGAAMATQNPGAFASTALPMYQQQAKKREAEEEKNRTYLYLKQNHPQLAAMVDAGMPLTTAWQQVVQSQKVDKPSSVQEFEYMQELGPRQRRKFRKFTNKVPKTVINNNMETSQDKFFGELGEKEASNFAERHAAAQDAAQSLRSNEQARQLLDKGVITGFGADFIVGFGKALQQAGLQDSNDAVANTEAFVGQRAQEVGRIIKLFGAGTGLSDADREFARKAAAGDITMNEQAIRRLLRINDEAARNVIKNYNRQAEQIPPGTLPYSLTVDPPGIGATQGQTQSGIRWQVGE